MRARLINLLAGLFLFSAPSFANPLCQKTVAALADPKIDAAHQAYELFKKLDPKKGFERFALNFSSNEALILGPSLTRDDTHLADALSSRLAYLYSRIATTPFGKPNILIQSFEVNLSRKLGGLAFEKFGRFVSRDKGFQVFKFSETLDLLRKLAMPLFNNDWVYLGLNSNDLSNPKLISSTLSSVTYDFPALTESRTKKEAVIKALSRNGTPSLIESLRTDIPEGATLDLFVQSTGFFSFRLIAIYTAENTK